MVYFAKPVPGTDWLVEEHGPKCYFGGTYPYEITARDLISGHVVTVATGDVGDVQFSFEPGRMTLTLDNRSWVDPVSNEFGGVNVVYDYKPHDDPADRAAYRRWVKEPQDPANRRWWCTNVYPERPASLQVVDNWGMTPDPANRYDKKGNANYAVTPYCPAP